MRKLSTLFGMFAMVVAFATSAQGATLKENMKEIGGIVKQISKTVADPTENSRNAASIPRLIELFRAVQTQVPDSIKNMPADKQGAAIADFQRLIQAEIDFSILLGQALTANDNARATSILKQMNATRREGHDKYEE